MDQVQSHARPKTFSTALAPSTEQIPAAQAQMFRGQEPDADLVARNLVSQQLANLPLQAGWIARLEAFFASGALGLDKLGCGFRPTGVEFFFANRSR